MEAIVLNTNFEQVAIIDDYKSFIWTERYDECGDFDLYLPLAGKIPDYFQKDYYLWKKGSDRLMIIDTLEVETSDEDGMFLIVTGNSLESILQRRIVWRKRVFQMTDLDGDGDEGDLPLLQDCVISLLEENIPASGARSLGNFIIEKSEDPAITKLTLEAEYLGEELYDVVSKLCKENEIGFKITYHETYTKGKTTYENAFVFSLFKGVDRSYSQSTNPYVTFSPDFDNLISSKYVDSYKSFKNVALAVGDSDYDNKTGEELNREQYVMSAGDSDTPHMGLNRREVFADATSLSTDDENGNTMKAERYQALLKQKAIDALIENAPIQAMEGEVEPVGSYVYRQDYDIGDTVQLVNEYGYEGRAYISEYVESCDDSGFSAYPTFNTIQKGWYESDE